MLLLPLNCVRSTRPLSRVFHDIAGYPVRGPVAMRSHGALLQLPRKTCRRSAASGEAYSVSRHQ